MSQQLAEQRFARAVAIKSSGGIRPALMAGTLDACADISLSEAVVLGLLRQRVKLFIGIFGHGTTDLGEVLRVYDPAVCRKVGDGPSQGLKNRRV